jgi:hypothetical protein
MRIPNNAGLVVEVDDVTGALLINGKPPEQVVEIGEGWLRASSVFCRGKHPKKVQGCRKRKKALMAAIKRYRFSFNFKQE